VDLLANKRQIKDAVKQLDDIKVAKVNTLIRYNPSRRALIDFRDGGTSWEPP
jgi:large subunit ribosomal protein L23Ae